MSVNSAWQPALDGEQRRHRQARQRTNAEAKARNANVKLTLVPGSRAQLAVVPADFIAAHHIVSPRKRRLELTLLAIAAVGLHAAVAWWMTHQPPAAPMIAAQVPPIEVVFTPPQIPPEVVQPKPQPVAKQLPLPKPVVNRLASSKSAPTPAVANQEVVSVPAQTAAPVATPAPVSETVTAARADANYLQNPAPQYPPFAQRQGWEGVVGLQVLVLPDGSPGKIELQQSSGRKTLDDAALEAVRNWRFVPAKRGEVAVEGWVNVPIEFKLGK